MFRFLDLEFTSCLEIIKDFSQPFFRGLSVYLAKRFLDRSVKQLRRMISLPTTRFAMVLILCTDTGEFVPCPTVTKCDGF